MLTVRIEGNAKSAETYTIRKRGEKASGKTERGVTKIHRAKNNEQRPERGWGTKLDGPGDMRKGGYY